MAGIIAKEYCIPDPEDLLACPYENAHMIRAKRMQYHLIKCRAVSEKKKVSLQLYMNLNVFGSDREVK